MIKAVIVGFAHMHVNEIAKYIDEQPETQLVACADIPSEISEISDSRYTRAWNMENVRENYCKNFYSDYTQMLDKEKPDIAYILCENYRKPLVVEQCAKRKIDVSIEKPIAVNYSEAKRIEKAVADSGILCVVNWPVLWRGYVHKLKHALDCEIAGKPLKMRYINGHTGPLGKGARHRGVMAKAQDMTNEERSKTWWHMENCGGGVLLDIGCYGCFFTQWLLGNGEKSVTSLGENLATPFGDTDDNFVSAVKYDDKMAVIEGTWTTPRAVIPSGPMVICTDGVVMCSGKAEDNPDVCAVDIYGEKIDVPEFTVGEEYKNMVCHYASYKLHGTRLDPMATLSENMRVMAVLDAVVRSCKSGTEEEIVC